MKATDSFQLQAGKSPDRIVSPNNNRYGNQLSENNLPWHLFSWNGTMCPRCIFTQLWSCQETCFCETGNWALMVKQVFSTFISWIIPASNLPEKHTGSFFSSWQQQFRLSFWVFQKKHAACHFLLGGCLTVQNHLISVTTDMAVNTHRTLPWQPFSWNGPLCHRCVFTQLWNSQETCFCEPGNWALTVKVVFFTFRSWVIPASNLPEKHTGSFFSSIQQLLSNFGVFSKQNKTTGCLLLLAGKSHNRTISD